ncbi:DUF1569 domain-containing protein [Litoribacter ruber]|uniref:DUF1569 domain-containing protein n=1 Tax=Litoribacter ruber TaxID=702568 RepID=UPI001BDAB73E|nr:DUF1569 domain-containing protein [Litoribacter ruber]MBT0811023.1 DUF1569 domain-containing protein [Litoribacter ruber]
MDKQLFQKLKLLQADQKPSFGIMTPQHMVEHLILTLKLSQGKIQVPTIKPTPEALAIKHNIIVEKENIPRGIQAPGTNSTLLPLRYNSLEEAKAELLKAWQQFELYYFQHTDATNVHPFFGELNYSEWKSFHSKHFQHHFSQFDIDFKH